MSRKARNNSFIENNRRYLHYFNRLKLLSISVFQWDNLPSSIDERFLELCLFDKGQVLFFRNKYNDELMCLNFASDGLFNVYNIPLKRRAYAPNGFQQDLTIENSVIIYNNFLRTSNYDTVDIYANKLMELDRTLDVNLKSQRYSVVFKVPESQRLTFRNLMMQWDGNEPFIYGDKALDLENSIDVINANAPYNIDKLDIHKNVIWNEAMTSLGIANANTDKKERLVESEVMSNSEQVEATRLVMLSARQQACKQINEMFGTNISVRFKDLSSKQSIQDINEVVEDE